MELFCLILHLLKTCKLVVETQYKLMCAHKTSQQLISLTSLEHPRTSHQNPAVVRRLKTRETFRGHTQAKIKIENYIDVAWIIRKMKRKCGEIMICLSLLSEKFLCGDGGNHHSTKLGCSFPFFVELPAVSPICSTKDLFSTRVCYSAPNLLGLRKDTLFWP